VATLKWKWILWQVVVPILGPIAISTVAVVLWWTGRTDFQIHWRLIVDITPWALTFYAVTLIGAALNDLIPDFSRRPGIGFSLILAALAVSLYAAFIVIWRHENDFSVGPRIWVATIILLAISVGLCYNEAKA
jgi:hypothetical protein